MPEIAENIELITRHMLWNMSISHVLGRMHCTSCRLTALNYNKSRFRCLRKKKAPWTKLQAQDSPMPPKLNVELQVIYRRGGLRKKSPILRETPARNSQH